MMNLLMMSITGSAMILVIALLRVCLQNKLHRSAILALWFWQFCKIRFCIIKRTPALGRGYALFVLDVID